MNILKKYFDPLALFLLEFFVLYIVLFRFWSDDGILFISNYVAGLNDNANSIKMSTFIIFNVIYFIGFLFFSGLYKRLIGSSRLDMFVNIFKSVLLSYVFLIFLPMLNVIFKFFVYENYSYKIIVNKVLFGFEFFFIVLIPVVFIHILYYSFRKFLFKYNIGRKRTLVIGFNKYGKDIVKSLQEYKYQIFNIIGYVDDGPDSDDVLGGISDLPEIVKNYRIDTIIFANKISDEKIYEVIFTLVGKNVNYYIAPDVMDLIKGYIKTQQLYGRPLIEILPEHMSLLEVYLKRAIDIFMSLLVLIFFAPFFVIIGIAIKLNSKGPIFYKQERLGRFWKPFMIYKFRTMYSDAEKHSGPQWATEDDPRITKVGKFLRKTRLDELPQFFNILFGEMSVVGPRPEREYFVKKLVKEVRFYKRRLIMKPGLTGWAQVHLEYDSDLNSVKNKVLYDIFYLENMSVKLDLKIIFKTIFVVLFGKGAH